MGATLDDFGMTFEPDSNVARSPLVPHALKCEIVTIRVLHLAIRRKLFEFGGLFDKISIYRDKTGCVDAKKPRSGFPALLAGGGKLQAPAAFPQVETIPSVQACLCILKFCQSRPCFPKTASRDAGGWPYLAHVPIGNRTNHHMLGVNGNYPAAIWHSCDMVPSNPFWNNQAE